MRTDDSKISRKIFQRKITLENDFSFFDGVNNGVLCLCLQFEGPKGWTSSPIQCLTKGRNGEVTTWLDASIRLQSKGWEIQPAGWVFLLVSFHQNTGAVNHLQLHLFSQLSQNYVASRSKICIIWPFNKKSVHFWIRQCQFK